MTAMHCKRIINYKKYVILKSEFDIKMHKINNSVYLPIATKMFSKTEIMVFILAFLREFILFIFLFRFKK